MNLLLDTHSFLWFIAGDRRLTREARSRIENPTHERQVSAACLWEIAIKVSLGKLSLTEPFAMLIPRERTKNAMTVLPVQTAHLARLIELPFHHRDPFDRLLAAQALAENLAVISKDEVLDAYGVRRIW